MKREEEQIWNFFSPTMLRNREETGELEAKLREKKEGGGGKEEIERGNWELVGAAGGRW